MNQSTKIITILISFITLTYLFSNPVFAASVSYHITDPIQPFPIVKGQNFYEKKLIIDYQEGQIFLAGDDQGDTFTLVDDYLNIRVIRPDGTIQIYKNTYQTGCSKYLPLPPDDITHLFLPGENQVTVRLNDLCGVKASSSSIYLVNKGLPELGPEPFLILPWEYQKHQLTFSDAALSMNSYFDHTYPVLSFGSVVKEPSEYIGQVTNYENEASTQYSYSSHDGYDYAKQGKAFINEPTLAAASGCATYHYSGATGNSIYINHNNHYQTRYYHLMSNGLITNQLEGECIQVNQGEQIGLIGYSGNVVPSGSNGAHIHFMVVHDKDEDGVFYDNIPDGIVDPYGWQSSEPDPWEQFQFEITEDDIRQGDTSYYLWQEQIANLDESFNSNLGVESKLDKFHISIPQYSLPESGNYSLIMDLVPNASIYQDQQQTYRSLGSIVDISVIDPNSQNITQFTKPYTLSIDFSNYTLDVYDLNSLQIYSSSNDQQWLPEETQVDWDSKTATAQIDHLTQFALMAKRRDLISPTTTLTISEIEPELETEQSTKKENRITKKLNKIIAKISNNQEVDDDSNNNQSPYSSTYPVQLDLDAADNQDGVGVEVVWYQLNQDSWKVYLEPIIIDQEGEYQVSYYSQDQDSNTEELQQATIRLDFTPPELEIGFNLDSLQTEISCLDSNHCQVESSPTILPKTGLFLITATDQAGNKTRFVARKRTSTTRKTKKTESTIKKSSITPLIIQYNQQSPTKIKQTKISVEKPKKSQGSIIQKLNIGDDRYKYSYNSDTNITSIIQYNKKIITNESTQSGVVKITAQTNNGQLVKQ